MLGPAAFGFEFGFDRRVISWEEQAAQSGGGSIWNGSCCACAKGQAVHNWIKSAWSGPESQGLTGGGGENGGSQPP